MVSLSRTTPLFNLATFLLSDGPAGFLLSWVAGFVDTSVFIILFGLFTAHVTGNIALAGASFVSEDTQTTITRLLMLPIFMLTVALTSLLARYVRRRGGPVFAVLLTAEAIGLTVLLILGITLSPALLLDVQEEYIFPIGMAGVVSMAIQNALMKEAKGVFKSYVPTTVMTGNTTQFTIDLVQYFSAKLSPQSPQSQLEAAESLDRIGRILPTILGFALGGFLAACFVLVSESWWSLVFPLAVVSLMAIVAYFRDAQLAAMQANAEP